MVIFDSFKIDKKIAYFLFGLILIIVFIKVNHFNETSGDGYVFTYFNIDPNDAFVGEPVNFNFRIQNQGNTRGNHTVNFALSEYIIYQNSELVLDSGEEIDISVDYIFDRPFEVDIPLGEFTENLNVMFLISSYRLAREYDNNEIAADAKYQDQIFCVEGYINDIGRTIWGDAFIVLEGEDFTGIQFLFSGKNEDQIISLNTGNYVRVKGKCTGKGILNIEFINSILISQ